MASSSEKVGCAIDQLALAVLTALMLAQLFFTAQHVTRSGKGTIPHKILNGVIYSTALCIACCKNDASNSILALSVLKL
jgi:hypothetical protein